MSDTTSVGDTNIFGQPVILSSSSRPNWADLAIERAAEIERLRAENGRLRAAGAVDISAVDLRTAARVVRSSSWPLDMRPSMDALAARLDQVAAQIDGSGGSDE